MESHRTTQANCHRVMRTVDSFGMIYTIGSIHMIALLSAKENCIMSLKSMLSHIGDAGMYRTSWPCGRLVAYQHRVRGHKSCRKPENEGQIGYLMLYLVLALRIQIFMFQTVSRNELFEDLPN